MHGIDLIYRGYENFEAKLSAWARMWSWGYPAGAAPSPGAIQLAGFWPLYRRSGRLTRTAG